MSECERLCVCVCVCVYLQKYTERDVCVGIYMYQYVTEVIVVPSDLVIVGTLGKRRFRDQFISLRGRGGDTCS